MTTLAILADIHGNMPALEAVIQDLRQVAVDHVVVAGDCINWGPFSQEVVERIAREAWAVIRGNNEFYLLDYQTGRARHLPGAPLTPDLLARFAEVDASDYRPPAYQQFD